MTVIVTGASGGMGAEVCERLAKAGHRLALCSDDGESLERLAKKMASLGAKVFGQTADVTDEAQVSSFFSQARTEFGSADALLNLAGLSIPSKIEDMDEKDYDRVIDVNLKGTFLCCKHFLKLTDSEKGARIINIGSMAALRANGNAPVYCTAKAAVNMLSKGLALQLRERNVFVTTLNPGGTDTGFWGDRPVAREKLMRPSDVADVIEFVLGTRHGVVFHEISFESSGTFQ